MMKRDKIGTGWRRTIEMGAIFMIGDGALGLLAPRRHVMLWRSDVAAADRLVRPFADRPGRRRLYGAVQVGAGIALAALLLDGSLRSRKVG